jgi:hypothetical protein
MGRTTPAVAAALLLLLPGVTAAQSVNMGGTFHGLEARARRVTLTFPDAVIEVRRTEGGMDGVLRDRGGVVGGRLHLLPGSRRVQWQHEGKHATLQEFALPDQAIVGLDWAAHQLYALHSDARTQTDGRAPDVAGDAGTWDGHLRRSGRVAARGASAGQLASRLEGVETTFDEIVVKATLDRHDRKAQRGKRIDYSKFTARIVDARTGAARGFVRWFDTAQVLTWKIEGGSQGVILPDRLPGGWTFTPTMAWANVQAYQFVTQAAGTLDAGVPFAKALRGIFARPAGAPPFAQVAGAIAPVPSVAWAALSATLGAVALPDVPTLPGGWARPWRFGGAGTLNEDGCDRLHWLDGSVFRACCDDHDRCYEKSGCSERSWFWPFAGSWSCQKCNLQVAYCFCTVSNPAYCGVGDGGGDGGSDGGGCTSVAGGFCPIECQTCQAR